jgi:hypothetical protein
MVWRMAEPERAGTVRAKKGIRSGRRVEGRAGNGAGFLSARSGTSRRPGIVVGFFTRPAPRRSSVGGGFSHREKASRWATTSGVLPRRRLPATFAPPRFAPHSVREHWPDDITVLRVTSRSRARKRIASLRQRPLMEREVPMRARALALCSFLFLPTPRGSARRSR